MESTVLNQSLLSQPHKVISGNGHGEVKTIAQGYRLTSFGSETMASKKKKKSMALTCLLIELHLRKETRLSLNNSFGEVGAAKEKEKKVMNTTWLF